MKERTGWEGRGGGERGERGGRNRETRGAMRRKERGDREAERPYFSGPCLEHVRTSARTSVRSRPCQHKRISRSTSVASCIRKARTHTHTDAHACAADCPVSYPGFTTLFKTRRRDTVRRDGTENGWTEEGREGKRKRDEERARGAG